MKRLASQFALMALAGGLMAASPAFAAPNSNGPNCRDPAQAKTAACMSVHKGQHGKPGPGGQAAPSGQGPFGAGVTGHPAPPPPPPAAKGPPGPPPGQHHMPPPPKPGMGGPGHMGPGQPGPGHMGPPRGFDAFRHSFHFPHFAPPHFDVRPGVVVPRAYGLQPLPPQIFAFYPMYRGYLFFVTPSGNIVVVSPRSLRIVAVL